MIRLVCAVCRDRGITVDDDGKPEWCDCARGEDMREEAEWVARFGGRVSPEPGEPGDPW